ncbi:TetR/AcrR family transcriptional regulator [Mycobacterium sp. LTG2003]
MPAAATSPSARQTELLEAAYQYALTHGLGEMSLRPLAAAIGSSPRVLLFLFGSKDGLVRALLERARSDELALLDRLRQSADAGQVSLAAAVEQVWGWLAADEHVPLLKLWTEAYARSLSEPGGPWAGFARATVQDWLDVLANYQPAQDKTSADGLARRTLALAVLRGGLLDLLATGDRDRVTSAVRAHTAQFRV